MRKTLFPLLLAILCCQFTPLSAQTAAPKPTRYNVYAYMKVAPGMYDDYLKMEKAYKKLHLADKKAGRLEDWSLAEVVSPAGTNTEYDFVCRNTYIGHAALAAQYERVYDTNGMESILSPAEIALVKRTNEIRKMVKVEVWSMTDGVWADDADTKAKLFVWNYFSIPEGKTGDDHKKVELDIWKPIMAARIKDGKMKGWGLLNMELPFGASMPYSQATVDGYTGMEQMLAPWFEDYFKKVHPGKDVKKLFKQTAAVCTLEKGEVRMMIDRLAW